MKKNNNESVVPIFGSSASEEAVMLDRLRDDPVEPSIAYRLIKDELINEGNARQNLATFCQTYMEPEATNLMAETMEKNAIDKSEYPQTADLEQKCVKIIADLWHAPDRNQVMGSSTVGSSEACMLAGMAMKFRWRNNAKQKGLDITNKKPNLVISSAYQICWEKFCVYWDIEMREVPVDKEHLSINTDTVMDYVDEYTIGIVGILGITYTGKFDDIKKLDELVEAYNQEHHQELVIHVDAASGGLFVPFINPNLMWDFRLKNVVSINSSGHKYGLVYPGIGWVLWKDKEYLPKELIFEVSYLGSVMPTMAINFSRSASQIIGQYYSFYRFGFNGYKEIHERTKKVAMSLAKIVEGTGLFKMFNTGENLPIVCFMLKEDANVEWSLYDLSDRLQMRGWQVPTYPFPKDMENTIVQRFVCRADMGENMANAFEKDFLEAIKELGNETILRRQDIKRTSVRMEH